MFELCVGPGHDIDCLSHDISCPGHDITYPGCDITCPSHDIHSGLALKEFFNLVQFGPDRDRDLRL